MGDAHELSPSRCPCCHSPGQVEVSFTCPSKIIFSPGFFSSLISSTTQSPHGREQPFKNKADYMTPFLRLPLTLWVKSNSLVLSTSTILLLSPWAQATRSFFLSLDCTKIALGTLTFTPSLLHMPCLRFLEHISFLKFRSSVQISLFPHNPIALYYIPLYYIPLFYFIKRNEMFLSIYLLTLCLFLPFRIKLHVNRDFSIFQASTTRLAGRLIASCSLTGTKRIRDVTQG